MAFEVDAGAGDGSDGSGEGDPFAGTSEARLGEAQAASGFAGFEELEFGEQGFGVVVAVIGVRRAGFDDDLVKFEEFGAVLAFSKIGGQTGEILTVASGGEFVEHLAEAVDVGDFGARTFGGGQILRCPRRSGLHWRG